MRRGSGRPTTTGNHWAGESPQKPAFVPVSRPSNLRSSSAGLAISLFRSTGKRGEERQNRCANGTAAGEKTDSDVLLYPESSGLSPATGDSGSPVVLHSGSRTTNQAQCPPLRVFVSLCLRRGWAGASASICVICGLKCVGGSVSSLCPLCLCG